MREQKWLVQTLCCWAFCMLLALPQPLCAQDTDEVVLNGRVTSAQTNEPLPNASVYALGADKGAATDTAGRYRLVLPPGPERVRVSYVGYEPRTLSVDLTGERQQLDVALEPHALDLDAVEVTARREEEEGDVRSTQMSAVTLPVAELEELPAFLGEVDVMKSLQLLPGVQSGTEGQTGLYVRGGGPAQNLILLDGAPVYNASHVLGFLSVFNADALDDVQLYKGGFPARYGGRLSSVVDITMRDGSREDYGMEGSIGLAASSLTAEGPMWNDDASFLVSARRTYIDALAQPFIQRQLSEGQGLTAYFYDANARLSYRPRPEDHLSLSLYGGNDVYGSRDENMIRREDGRPPRRERYRAGSDWGNRIATLRWQHLFSEEWSLAATLLYSRYRFGISARFTQIDPERTPTETFEEANYTSGIEDLGAKLDFEYDLSGRHHLRFGASLTRHAFSPGVSQVELQLGEGGAIDTTLTPNTYRFSGLEGYLYAEDDAKITGRLKANLGVHASAMQVGGRTYASIQPRLSARCLLRPNWSVKASFASMEQYLHLLTNTGINLPTDLWVAATDRVEPQHAWQAALGTTLELGGGDAGPTDYEINVEGYYKDMRGLLEYEQGASFAAPGENWQDKIETGRGWAYGGELFVQKKTGRTTGWLGYTLAWSRRRFDALNDGNAFPYRYDRRHDVSLVLKHELSESLDLSASWVYGTGQAVTLATARYLDGRLDPRLIGSITGGGSGGPSGGSGPVLRAYGPRGGYRMAPYHRLDIALNWHLGEAFFFEAGESTLSVGAYNAYNRQNPFYLYATRDQQGDRVYRQASLFPVLPALSYRFEF